MISNKENITISFKTTLQQLREIEQWLTDEDKKTNEGFYCNWEHIQHFYDKGTFASISVKNKCVGFITWRLTGEVSAKIEIAEVKPSYRKKGLGKQLVDELIIYLIRQNIIVAHLSCSPINSRPIWLKMGFSCIPYSPRFSNLEIYELYKILIPHERSGNEEPNTECIELWADDPVWTNDDAPQWKWKLEFENGTRTLSKPIIHPVSSEWRIRWRNGNQTKLDKIVKRFNGGKYHFGDFMVIGELPML